MFKMRIIIITLFICIATTLKAYDSYEDYEHKVDVTRQSWGIFLYYKASFIYRTQKKYIPVFSKILQDKYGVSPEKEELVTDNQLDNVKMIISDLDQLEGHIPDITDFLYSVCLVKSGKQNEAVNHIVERVNQTMAPEQITVLKEICKMKNIEAEFFFSELMDCILPVNFYCTQRDKFKGIYDNSQNKMIWYQDFGGELPWDIPLEGYHVKSRHAKIIDKFAELGMYEEAWKSRVEIIFYANRIIIKDVNFEGNISPRNFYRLGNIWFMVAENAYLAGEKELALEFLAKAAVLGDNELYDKAMILAKKWFSENDSETIEKVKLQLDPEYKKKTLYDIAKVYVELNLHPRAWNLIKENSDLFPDADDIIKDIQKEWLSKIEKKSKGYKVKYIMGYKVKPDVNVLDIIIPYPFAEGTLKKVQERLKKPTWEMEDKYTSKRITTLKPWGENNSLLKEMFKNKE